MGCIFLSIFMIPAVKNSSSAWMNYALCISTGAVIPLVIFANKKHNEKDMIDGLDIAKNGKEISAKEDRKTPPPISHTK